MVNLRSNLSTNTVLELLIFKQQHLTTRVKSALFSSVESIQLAGIKVKLFKDSSNVGDISYEHILEMLT